MGPLRNARHERFVQALLEGQNATAAYQQAGYARDDANAARLSRNPKVRERLLELQNQAAADNRITIESICKELDDACAVAKARGQAAAMVSASALRAKLAGLGVERQQIEVGGPGDFAGCNTSEEIHARMAEDFFKYEVCDYHDLRPKDVEQVRAIIGEGIAAMRESWERARAIVEAVKARPTSYIAKPKKLAHLNGKAEVAHS